MLYKDGKELVYCVEEKMIKRFVLGPVRTCCFILICPYTKQCAIIDPGMHALKSIQSYIDQYQLTPTHLLLTHSHWDHIIDCYAVQQHYKIPVFVHRLDQPNLYSPGIDGITEKEIQIHPCAHSKTIEDNQEIDIGCLHGVFLHTPGHSPGSGCYYFSKEHILISGDTLLKKHVGITNIPGGSSLCLKRSLYKLSALPKNTRVFPGHGEETSIGEELYPIQRGYRCQI